MADITSHFAAPVFALAGAEPAGQTAGRLALQAGKHADFAGIFSQLLPGASLGADRKPGIATARPGNADARSTLPFGTQEPVDIAALLDELPPDLRKAIEGMLHQPGEDSAAWFTSLAQALAQHNLCPGRPQADPSHPFEPPEGSFASGAQPHMTQDQIAAVAATRDGADSPAQTEPRGDVTPRPVPATPRGVAAPFPEPPIDSDATAGPGPGISPRPATLPAVPPDRDGVVTHAHTGTAPKTQPDRDDAAAWTIGSGRAISPRPNVHATTVPDTDLQPKPRGTDAIAPVAGVTPRPVPLPPAAVPDIDAQPKPRAFATDAPAPGSSPRPAPSTTVATDAGGPGPGPKPLPDLDVTPRPVPVAVSSPRLGDGLQAKAASPSPVWGGQSPSQDLAVLAATPQTPGFSAAPPVGTTPFAAGLDSALGQGPSRSQDRRSMVSAAPRLTAEGRTTALPATDAPPGPQTTAAIDRTGAASLPQRDAASTIPGAQQAQVTARPLVALSAMPATAALPASGPSPQHPVAAVDSDTPDASTDGIEIVTATAGPPERTAQAGATPVRHSVSPQHIARQLAAAAPRPGDQPVELRLNPEELGHVRMSLLHGDGSISITIQADRGETLDLMRRHIAQLEAEFRDIGYSDIQFSFGASGQGRGEAWTQGGEPHQGGTSPSRETTPGAASLAASARPAPDARDGLDLRL